MAFDPIGTVTPVRIGRLQVFLVSADPAGTEPDGATYRFEVVMSDESAVTRVGNLVPHLTQGQVTALLNFMADLRAQAAAQVLPETP